MSDIKIQLWGDSLKVSLPNGQAMILSIPHAFRLASALNEWLGKQITEKKK